MTAEQVQFLRDLYGDANLFLFTDNAKLYNVRSEKTHVIWDENNELVHTLRPNTNFYSQSKEPAVFESFPFEMIQYIGSVKNKTGLQEILDELKEKGLVDDVKISMILKEYEK